MFAADGVVTDITSHKLTLPYPDTQPQRIRGQARTRDVGRWHEFWLDRLIWEIVMIKKLTAVWLALGIVGSAQAALFDRGNGLIYDDVFNITWMADMNYVASSGYSGSGVSTNGLVTWYAATTWAADLNYGGFSDWRLPTLIPYDSTCSSWSYDPDPVSGPYSHGLNCRGGELSHLFVSYFGNEPNVSVQSSSKTSEQQRNFDLFVNVGHGYWSGTSDTNNPSDAAWNFTSYNGTQNGYGFKTYGGLLAVAVRDGDVPAPSSVALSLLGLALLGFARSKRFGSH